MKKYNDLEYQIKGLENVCWSHGVESNGGEQWRIVEAKTRGRGDGRNVIQCEQLRLNTGERGVGSVNRTSQSYEDPMGEPKSRELKSTR